ncbi:MAG: NAD(+)/NADH kinase [Pirellulaceae bacterium]|nr:NAD(+)/NADH kinase [Pirellulaceae bacterium]
MTDSGALPSSDCPWRGPPARRPRVLLLGSGDRENVPAAAERMRPLIERYADLVLEDLRYAEDLGRIEADLAIVLGGDGSILRAASQMANHQIPVLGVNLGKLGFLADLSPEELVEVIPRVCAGDCQVVEHLMFRCRVFRGSQAITDQLGLNEMAVLAGPPFSLLNLDLYVDSELATTYSCDGLIISTPVGSTAHSLSAGGPILRKNLQAFVILPISPHSITVRPVVDTADRTYEVVARCPHEATSVVVDGRVLCRLAADDRVRVERAEPRFKLVQVPGHSYYRTLREKLDWGGRMRTRDE